MRVSPFLLLHLRQALMLYIGARVLVTGALLWGANPKLGHPTVVGVDYAVVMIAVTLLLHAVNRRRLGAPDLLENLGIDARTQVMTAALPALIGETMLVIATQLVGAR